MSQVCKPNPVSRKRDGNYLSSSDITTRIKRSTRNYQSEQLCLVYKYTKSPLHDLAPSGVYTDPNKSGLQKWTSVITNKAVGSYPAISPLSQTHETVYFLLHFP